MMANGFDGGLKIDGLQDLQRALRELPVNIGRNVLRGAVSAGAAEVRQEAKNKAPVYHGDVTQGHPPAGTLKRSLYQKQIRELSDNFRQVFFVGVRRGKKYQKQGKNGNLSQDAFYWTFVEFGTEKMPAQSFLRPAFESRKQAAVDRMKEYMTKRIPDEVAKLKGASK
jgi:HK97 gp10 family phage protein